jgi:hypothetical protein
MELLRAKNVKEELREHWIKRFLLRHPDLKTKFVSNRNKD